MKYALVFLVVVIVVIPRSLWGQMDLMPHKPKFALKTHVYAPLSLIAVPIYDKNHLVPFGPRNYAVQGELSLNSNSSLELALGFRNRHVVRGSGYEERIWGFRATLSYRRYLKLRSEMSGFYVSPFLQFQKGEALVSSENIPYHRTARAYSGGAHAGYQRVLGKHFLINAALGPELGWQVENATSPRSIDVITSFDAAGTSLSRRDEYSPTSFFGAALSGYISVGWLF